MSADGALGSPPLGAATVDPLIDRCRALAARHPQRVLLGIAGPPGAGKSTLAARLVEAWGSDAVVVPMDGFHLATAALTPDQADRRGAPDTFDADGYVALLGRLRRPGAAPMWVPEFRRGLEEPIAAAISVGPETRLVITEGNYLLDAAEPWPAARALLHEVWYLDLDAEERRRRLVSRHIASGRDPASAAQFAAGSDELNAQRVAAGRARADLVITG